MRRQGIHFINRTKVPAPFFHPIGDDAGQYTFQGPSGQGSTSGMVYVGRLGALRVPRENECEM